MSEPVDGPYRGKRLFDLIVVTVVAVPVIVIGLLCALAVKLTSPGPVFFRQERVGRDGRAFRIWKFRTMVHADNPVFADADLVTSAGRILRGTSLDELPQLLNVLAGHMSLVGPRPTLAYQAERWSDRQSRRLAVRPGLTGLAQVIGRNRISWDERIELDLRYLDTQSWWLDICLIARTGRALIVGRGSESTASDDPIARVVEPAT